MKYSLRATGTNEVIEAFRIFAEGKGYRTTRPVYHSGPVFALEMESEIPEPPVPSSVESEIERTRRLTGAQIPDWPT